MSRNSVMRASGVPGTVRSLTPQQVMNWRRILPTMGITDTVSEDLIQYIRDAFQARADQLEEPPE
jgi:hypothetical protein